MGLTFYHAPQSRSLIAHWMIEEVGVPYEMQVLDLQRGDQKDPEYLAVNPMGKVPAIKHKMEVVTEAAAICCYLADAFPEAGLAIPIGDARRGTYLKWLFFGPSCLEPAVADRLFKQPEVRPSGIGYGTLEDTLETIARGLSHGSYLMGDKFTAADVVIGSGLRWGQAVGIVPQREEFQAYLERLAERPALQRVFVQDKALVEKLAAQQ